MLTQTLRARKILEDVHVVLTNGTPQERTWLQSQLEDVLLKLHPQSTGQPTGSHDSERVATQFDVEAPVAQASSAFQTQLATVVQQVESADRPSARAGVFFVYDGEKSRVPARAVLASALSERFVQVRTPAVALGRPPRFFFYVDGNYGRVVRSQAYQTIGRPNSGLPTRLVVFTRFNHLIRMGHKHVMGDALRGLSFVPETYTSRMQPPAALRGLWFYKPAFEAEGRGIRVIDNPRHVVVQHSPPHVLQKGVDPYLYKGHKFDVRIWVTVRSDGYFLVHQDGRLRFSCMPYVSSADADPSTHITNVAYQPGGEWRNEWPTRLSALPCYESFMKQVNEAVAHVLAISFYRNTTDGDGAGNSSIFADPRLFHITGWDFIADAKGKVWILEVNASPAAHNADEATPLYTEWCRESIKFATDDNAVVHSRHVSEVRPHISVPFPSKAFKPPGARARAVMRR